MGKKPDSDDLEDGTDLDITGIEEFDIEDVPAELLEQKDNPGGKEVSAHKRLDAYLEERREQELIRDAFQDFEDYDLD